ncbi:hypothetical protein SprV_0100100200 [Sparganum proliferum]
MSAPRSWVHPGCIVPRRKAGEGVGEKKAVLSAGSQKEEAVVVTAADPVGTQHFHLDSVVCPDADTKVNNDNELVRLQYNHQEDAQDDVSVASLCLSPASPEEGAPGTHLQLALFREPGLDESSVVLLAAPHFSSDKSHLPLRPVFPPIFYKNTNNPVCQDG